MNTIQKITFTDSHFFIGIDAHLRNWKVTIRFNGLELKTFSMNPAPLELIAYLQKHYPDGIYHIVYEAGFCGFWALCIFRQHEIDCIVVNPADVPTSNKEKVDKNDPVDSRKLARELENKSLHGIYIPDLAYEELRALVKTEPELAQHLINIKTAKGLSDITILTVLAETQCFKFVSNQKQLASYAGFDIVFNDSGVKKGKTSISKKGNTFIRKVLFMPALSACRANPKLKDFYQRLVAKGKNKKLAIIAVARKLLLLIYTLWKTNSPYIPDYKPAHLVSEALSA